MMHDSAADLGARDLDSLRALHELARQLLPLATAREVARDGLLCIAGITAIGSGAVLWRNEEARPLELLTHFGLGPMRLRQRYRVPAEALRFLAGAGPLTLESARRRPAGRTLVSSLEPLSTRLGEAWLLP